jgi:arylsulfatase A-like enzyme
MLGDHNRWGKKDPYHPSVGIPLTVWTPDCQAGQTSDALVSLMDLTATFLDYADVDIPQDMDSRSLRNLLKGKTKEHREYVLSGLNNWRLAYDGQYKYIEGYNVPKTPKGEPVLFDLQKDPTESTNVYKKAKEEAQRLKIVLPHV